MPILLGPEKSGSTAIGTLEAIEDAAPGDVLVFDNRGRLDLNTFGGISAFCADRVGIKGAICDGASRDVDDMRAQNFPLYARGPITTTVKGRVGMAGYDIPVECSGVEVAPGDYVVADGSGVIFIPGDEVESVLEIGSRFQEYEREIKKRIAKGEDIVHVFEDMEYEDFESRSGVGG
jgi:regulator of RNase E activity RraA